MMYIPLTHLPPAAVSAAIWALSRPDAETMATRLYCGWITHPTTGQHALTIPESDTQPIHPDATSTISAFVAALRPIVGDVEADALASQLDAARGSRVNVIEMLPPSLAAHLLTQEQAEAAGWFPAQEVTL